MVTRSHEGSTKIKKNRSVLRVLFTTMLTWPQCREICKLDTNINSSAVAIPILFTSLQTKLIQNNQSRTLTRFITYPPPRHYNLPKPNYIDEVSARTKNMRLARKVVAGNIPSTNQEVIGRIIDRSFPNQIPSYRIEHFRKAPFNENL